MKRPLLRQTPASDLTRHFFREFFYLRFLTDTGADSVKRAIIGVVAGLLSLSILFPQFVIARYATMPTAAAYQRALLSDQLFTICVAMFIVGLVAALVCQSLFPDEIDYRVLMALPVTRRRVFGTKMLALVLFAGIFIVFTNLIFGIAFAAAAGGRWAEQTMTTRVLAHGAVAGLASLFAGACVMSVQGLIAVLSPRSWLRPVSVATQTAMICALILSLPAIARASSYATLLQTRSRLSFVVPPLWFLGLEQTMSGHRDAYFLRLSILALLGLAASILAVAVCYLTVYRRFDQLALRSSVGARRARVWPVWLRWSSANRSRHPLHAAIAAFTTATLRRSGLHQVVFYSTSAVGVALAINSVVGLQPAATRGDAAVSRWLVAALLEMPLVFMFFGVAAVRSALVLPLDVRANWVFRLTEDPATRPHQLVALERALIRLGVTPYLALTLVIHMCVLGPIIALLALVPTMLLGLVLVEWALRHWHRIPFTCTYIPGKRQLVHTLLLTFAAYTVFVSVGGGLIHASLTRPALFVILTAGLLAARVLMHRARLATWRRAPLEFEDSLPDDVQVIAIFPQ